GDAAELSSPTSPPKARRWSRIRSRPARNASGIAVYTRVLHCSTRSSVADTPTAYRPIVAATRTREAGPVQATGASTRRAGGDAVHQRRTRRARITTTRTIPPALGTRLAI